MSGGERPRRRPRRSDRAPHRRRAPDDRRLPSGDAAPPPKGDGGPTIQWLVVAGIILLAVAAVVWFARGGILPAPGSDSGTGFDPARPTLAADAPGDPEGGFGDPGGGVVGLFVQPDDGRAPVLDEIAAARRSIDLEVYLLSDEETIAALEAAAARGVRVRVLLEEHPFGGAGRQPEVFARLERSGIAVRWNNPAFTFGHIKSLVVDDRVALVMNQNLTYSSFTKNRELGVVTTRPAEVAQTAAIFEADWTRTAEPPPGPLLVSPTDSRDRLLNLIGSARRRLDVYAEVVRDPEMLDAIAAAVGRGVRVRLVMSGRAGDDNADERQDLARAGAEVRLLNRTYIHAKLFLVDDERAFVGSQNMTATSLDQNRELGAILDDPGAVARIARVFGADFAAATPEAPA